MNLRRIQENDNLLMGEIVREVLTEFGANRPGFAWQDPELDALSEAYAQQGRCYLVLEDKSGKVVGGGGFAEFKCDESNVCELQKMYLQPAARGLGAGKQLLSALLEEAKDAGYQSCYLESLNTMRAAISLYEGLGFEHLSAAKGDSGHNACNVWMSLDLS